VTRLLFDLQAILSHYKTQKCHLARFFALCSAIIATQLIFS
jgi:hypothetical protein